LAVVAAPAVAQHLADFLPEATPAELVPGATRFGPPEGTPAIVAAYGGDKLLGWVYLNTDLTTATGYSGWPIRILIGITTEWRIAGAKLVEQHEPLLVSGVDPARVEAVMGSYVGLDVTGITSIAGYRPTAIISGASMSMTVMGDSILRSAVLLLRQQHPGASSPVIETGWQAQWRAEAGRIAVLGVALALLTVVFFGQQQLARRPVLQDRLRVGFLLFTLLWIGGYAGAQLSVVNVLDFLSALRGDFHWDGFLMAPLVFILWAATAVAMLFWNRGAFCGWLCPYGAAQELLNRAARRLGIRQVAIPFGLHQRLVALKYVIFLGLFGISLGALSTAEWAAEVEPFRTVFVLRFARAWPFVLYAVAPLAAGLVVERFFCRYLCPLGAALAIPARLRLFDWLRRWRDCGNPCQRCAGECPVQAIHPEGNINPAECIQCLHCQMLYHHEQHCPVMVKRRQRRDKFAALRTAGE
jgi:polyferredoxin